MRLLKLNLFFAFLLLSAVCRGQTVKSKVQSFLAEIAERDPNKVSFILETRKWYLNQPRSGYLNEADETRLKAAFIEDIGQITKAFAWKYLLDWKLIAAKAARETFWGTSYLCNKAQNYFGIRTQSKPWACEVFGFCDGVVRNDPTPASFIAFPDYEASLWMFIHTIYNTHFLARYPDQGLSVKAAILYERKYGRHYWQGKGGVKQFAAQLSPQAYTALQTIKTWSGYKNNNLCIACDVKSDLNWISKVEAVLANTK